jgi:hypothetical protein
VLEKKRISGGGRWRAGVCQTKQRNLEVHGHFPCLECAAIRTGLDDDHCIRKAANGPISRHRAMRFPRETWWELGEDKHTGKSFLVEESPQVILDAEVEHSLGKNQGGGASRFECGTVGREIDALCVATDYIDSLTCE